jgi:hypothetical protein
MAKKKKEVIAEEVNPNWGGVRKNAGRKYKYGEATKVMTVRVPISKIQSVKDAIQYVLQK